MVLIKTAELRAAVDELIGSRSLSDAVGNDSGALRGIWSIRHEAREWTSYWRGDTILTALGRPEILQTLTLKG